MTPQGAAAAPKARARGHMDHEEFQDHMATIGTWHPKSAAEARHHQTTRDADIHVSLSLAAEFGIAALS